MIMVMMMIMMMMVMMMMMMMMMMMAPMTTTGPCRAVVFCVQSPVMRYLPWSVVRQAPT
jgi:hypothetical protein